MWLYCGSWIETHLPSGDVDQSCHLDGGGSHRKVGVGQQGRMRDPAGVHKLAKQRTPFAVYLAVTFFHPSMWHLCTLRARECNPSRELTVPPLHTHIASITNIRAIHPFSHRIFRSSSLINTTGQIPITPRSDCSNPGCHVCPMWSEACLCEPWSFIAKCFLL